MAGKYPLKAEINGTERRVEEFLVTDFVPIDAGGTGATTIGGAATALGFIPTSEKAAVNGVATLDAGGKIPVSQIPATALPEVYVVADATARLALTVQEGDEAIQTDTGDHWIYDGTTWQQRPNFSSTVVVQDDGVQISAAANTLNFLFPIEAVDAGSGVMDVQLGERATILLRDGATVKNLI